MKGKTKIRRNSNMCGIWGFITNETVKGANDRRKYCEQALIVGTVRGDDGAGVFLVPHAALKDEEADWVRYPADGYRLLQTKELGERLGYNNMPDYRAIIGHNRAGTAGSVKMENTHPFQEGPITLVHNGTLDSTFHMGKSMHDLKDQGVEVDSHVICHNLAEATDPTEVLGTLEGSFALVWHDARDMSINIIRNEKRMLHVMAATCEDTVLIASEAEMLYWLAVRNNFGVGEIVYPKAGSLMKFLPGKTVPEIREVPLNVPRRSGGHRSSGAWSPVGQQSSPRSSGRVRPSDPVPPWEGTPPTNLAKSTLQQLGLKVEDQLKFIPHQISAIKGRHTSLVNGRIFVTGKEPINARIIGLSHAAIKGAIGEKEVWTVSPVLVSQLDPNTPLVHVRMTSRRWTEQVSSPDQGATGGRIPRMGSRGSNEYLPGPKGEYIPIWEWLSYTSDGCIQCGGEVHCDDAEDTQWVEGGSRPVCAGCVLDNLNVARMGMH